MHLTWQQTLYIAALVLEDIRREGIVGDIQRVFTERLSGVNLFARVIQEMHDIVTDGAFLQVSCLYCELDVGDERK